MITLFVGDNGEYLSQIALAADSAAILIDHRNWKEFLLTDHAQDITVYTSFGDLPKITKAACVFFDVLQKADRIQYCPPDKWSDYSKKFEWYTNQTITEYFLYHVQLLKSNVDNLNISAYGNSDYLELADTRTTDDPQIWVAGCSISHGVGVESHEKYGALISGWSGCQVSYLTRGGSSIDWAKDQILRSDIRKDDIVIWGITQENRAPRAIDGKILAEVRPDILLDETSLYRAVTSVYQIVNFCNKVSARLILLPLLCSERLQMLIQNLDEYEHLPYRLNTLDYGSDDMHPGPLQHHEWANICLERISNFNLFNSRRIL
jgi:hypothetical protein